MNTDDPRSTLGEAIRYQREMAKLPMRQLATMVGISNPYLSQIERGLRAPSAQVLDAIAESLQTTADALSGRDGSDEEPAELPVLAALGDDPRLTASQRQALTEVYLAFIATTAAQRRTRQY
jgi:transcriptional regulator with XRE-family HTH domain